MEVYLYCVCEDGWLAFLDGIIKVILLGSSLFF